MANTIANTSYDAMEKTLGNMSQEIEKFASRGADDPLSETDMIKFNMVASRYSSMVNLTSGLIKNLTDTEKQVANKM